MTLNQYEHKTLQEINSNYIKDLFRFFSYEYTQMYKDTYRIKEAIETQIEKRMHNTNMIYNWRITIDGPTLSEVRDTTIHNILSSRSSLLSDDNKRHPIKINFAFSQSKSMEIEICEFIIE
jgi:hypothetical protein